MGRVQKLNCKMKCALKMDYQKLFSNVTILKLADYSAKIFKSIPIELTKTSTKPTEYTVSVVNHKNLCHLKNRSLLAKALAGVLLLQCILISYKTSLKKNIYEYVISWLSLWILANATFHLHELQKNSNELIAYLRGIFYLQQANLANTRLRVSLVNQRLNRIFALMSLCTGFVFPLVFVLGFHYSKPCQASLIGYQLMTECRTGGNSAIELYQYLWRGVEKLLVFLMNIWVMYFTLNATVFTAAVGMIVSPIIFRETIQG